MREVLVVVGTIGAMALALPLVVLLWIALERCEAEDVAESSAKKGRSR